MFLVATYVMKPRNPNRTKEPGYMKNPDNVQWDEQLYVVKKLNRKDETYGKIIIDFTKKRVIRNGFNSNLDYRELTKYFYTNYPKYLTPVLEGLDPELLNELTSVSQNVQAAQEAGSGPECTTSSQSNDTQCSNPSAEGNDRGVESNDSTTETTN
ncbi:MAG: hypothetical protein N2235_10590 [Fischerella sp.]|nr:hypothetical protein [Fischerella sp.]